jgi:hypothetical protein
MSNIQKSSNPKKKYSVKVTYNNQTKLIHFGSSLHKDYTIYSKELSKEDADKRKQLYIARHSKNEDFNNPLTASFWTFTALRSNSRWILWEEPTVSVSLKKVLNKYPSIKLEKIE